MQSSAEKKQIRKVIFASSVGTLIEWYDFYIFGSLAPIIAAQFFPKTNPTAALLSTLATFAAGFIVRPFGALVFGRLYTSWIQTTATLGLLLSLGIILITRQAMAPNSVDSIRLFEDWGWRIPFWFSVVLVGMSIYIRLKMHESPMFSKLKAEGKISVNPIKESLMHRANLKMVLLALFGATMGQGVVWYTGQFYAQTFLENVCKVDFSQTRTIMIWAIIFATPLFIFFGNLSDKVGRKWIIMAGLLFAVVLYRPIYKQMLNVTSTEESMVDQSLTNIERVIKPVAGKGYALQTTSTLQTYGNGIVEKKVHIDTLMNDGLEKSQALEKVSKQLPTDRYWMLIGLIFIQILFVTMSYGPIAAFLVEIFPTKIRYTSMSLPYHLGNGVFGGLTPFIAVLLGTMYSGDLLVGLWYPIIVAGLCLVIGSIYLNNVIDKNIND